MTEKLMRFVIHPNAESGGLRSGSADARRWVLHRPLADDAINVIIVGLIYMQYVITQN